MRTELSSIPDHWCRGFSDDLAEVGMLRVDESVSFPACSHRTGKSRNLTQERAIAVRIRLVGDVPIVVERSRMTTPI